MTTTVQVSIFSGRPNPRFELSTEADAALTERIRRLRPGDKRHVVDVCPTGFGVFEVRRENERGRRQFIAGGGLVEFPLLPYAYADDVGIEDFLIDICPPGLFPKQPLVDIFALLRFHRQLPTPAQSPPPVKSCSANPAADSQAYDPWWALTPYYRWDCNNCYDYANNQATDTFSQPGLGGGQRFSSYDCGNMGAAAIRDGLVRVPNSNDSLAPGAGWYVALLLGKTGSEMDFHWVKQDASGCWSHKLGMNAITDKDSNGARIYSPETATFEFGANKYDKFCGYFRSNIGVTIKGDQPTTLCYDHWPYDH